MEINGGGRKGEGIDSERGKESDVGYFNGRSGRAACLDFGRKDRQNSPGLTSGLRY